MLKNEWGEVFVTLLKDLVKQIINTCNFMMIKNQVSILHILIMSQYLHYGEFKYLNTKEIDKFDVNSISRNSPVGYILEVDHEYPDELHELHNGCLLAPEKLEISQNMLSNYCSNIANKCHVKIGSVKRLVPNLGNKSKYVLCWTNLQLYLLLGKKLVNIHRILKS